MNVCDLWLWPIVVEDGANQIVVVETAAGGVASIPPGKYWPYLDANAPTEFTDAYPSFYAALETAVDNAASGTYHLEVATPTLSTEFVGGGLAWVQDAGPDQFGFTMSASFTLDASLLGLGPDSGGLRDPDHVSDFSRRGVWQSPRCRAAAFANVEPVQFANRGGRESRQQRRWRTEHLRLLEYHWIPAGHVHDRACEDASYASAAGLAVGDHGNYLFDLWDQGLSRLEDVILIHQVPTDGITLEVFDLGAGWEIVSALDDRVRGSFGSLLQLQQRTGAHFGVEIPVASMSYRQVLDRYPAVADTYYRRGV